MRSSILKYFSLTVIGWYLFLCTVHYFNQRPLWNDEECVFQSVRNFSAFKMFNESLDSLQVFPRVYLFLIQQFSTQFDFHLLSLRFFPYVAMMSAFFIWIRLADAHIKDRFLYFVFLLSWPASVTLIYYSAELKQYSLDVCLSAILLWFLYRQAQLALKGVQYRALLCVLPAFVLFSYPAYLFMPLIFWNILRSSNRLFQNPDIYIFGFSTVLFSGLSYYFDMRLASKIVYSGYGDYFVFTDSIQNFFKTTQEGINNLFSRWFVESPRFYRKIARVFVFFGLAQMFVSFFQHIKKDNYKLHSLHTIAFVLFIELFLLGVFKKYPFTVPRTSLFFCPIVLWLTVEGIGSLLTFSVLTDWRKSILGLFSREERSLFWASSEPLLWKRPIKRFHKFLFGTVISFYIVFLVVVSLGLGRQIFSGDLGAQPTIWKGMRKTN